LISPSRSFFTFF
jgi:hypothetical protein